MIDKDWLLLNYIEKKMSLKQCGKLLNKYGTRVSRALKKYGIPVRSVRDAYYVAINEKRRNTAISSETAKKISDSNKGRKRSVESILKQKNTIKERKSFYGRKPSHGKGFYLKFDDNIQYFRSTWECIYAVYLYKNNKCWVYEPNVFKFGDGSIYIPDFLVDGRYYEVKGWLQQRHIDKVNKIKKEYGIDIIFIRKKDIDALGITWEYVEQFIVAASSGLYVECPNCSKMFLRKRKSSKFCSIQCSGVHWKNKHSIFLKCINCNKQYRKPQSLSNSKFCSRLCKDSYR